MKNRDYKEFAAGEYYHIYNRGNGKQDIFLDHEDYSFFLRRLKENVLEERVPLWQRGEPSPGGYVRKILPSGCFTIVCYCLMPNHFHFLIRQDTDLPISKLMGKVCTSYAMYFNKKYNRVGSLVQNAFKGVLIDSDSYLVWLSAYIHQNPQLAGLVDNLEQWQWGSYLDYIGLRSGVLCNKEIILSQFSNRDAYKKFVANSYEKIKSRKDIQVLLLEELEGNPL